MIKLLTAVLVVVAIFVAVAAESLAAEEVFFLLSMKCVLDDGSSIVDFTGRFLNTELGKFIKLVVNYCVSQDAKVVLLKVEPTD